MYWDVRQAKYPGELKSEANPDPGEPGSSAPTPAREAVGITKPNKMGLVCAAPVGEKSE